MHWRECGLEHHDASFQNSQRVETFDDHPEQEDDESSKIVTSYHDITRTSSTSATKLNISKHFAENYVDLESKSGLQNDETDNEIEQTKTCNNDICITTNPMEADSIYLGEADLSEQQLNGNDATLKRTLRNLDFKVMS